MRVIALFGRGNVGKTHCLGHLINLMYQEMFGHGCLIEGQDKSVTFEYHGLRITICTWGDTSEDEQKNLDYISCQTPDIAIVATRTKGGTVELVRQYCERKGCSLKWVEKYVANPEDASEQEYMNHLQARQILEYIRDVIEGHLYYVDCISAIDVEGKRYHVALFGTEMTDEGFPRSFSIELNENQMHYFASEQRIKEDDFVWYHPDSNHMMRLASDASRANELRRESQALRQELIKLEVNGDGAWAISQRKIDRVKSYHVKVGHGNCSFILIKYEIGYDLWMVDCSTYDYLTRCDYSLNLLCCLKCIAEEVGVDVKNLHVSRFMLTHTHFDHYNGLRYLMNHGVVDGKTLVYANLHYDCSSVVWCDVLKRLKGLSCRFVEPISDNLRQGVIRILHPECRLYKNSESVEDGVTNRVVANANNASVVYSITLHGKMMTLPGDLETVGFKEMSGHAPCQGNLSLTHYYVVSHHGSLNGHPDVMCMSKGAPNPKPLTCVSQNVKKAILMGRNGAYRGIYSQRVIDYWGNAMGVLEYTENALHYLVLDWENDKVVMG